MKSIQSTALFISLTLLSNTTYSSETNPIKIFNSSNYNEIIKNRDKNPFIMIFWSIECSPCLKEMNTISKLTEKERNKFIFISTDGHDMEKEVSNLLFKLDLEKENNWIFNSNSTEKIIGSIDTRWYGETPRSYYFDKNKNRTLLKNR